MQIKTDKKLIEEILIRGVEDVVEKETLVKKLQSGKKLRIKYGIDPTGPKIHIGRATTIWKLKDFQDLGHQVVLIIGDFTAQIGDASDKAAARKPLSKKDIKENMKEYVPQLGKILNMSEVELRYNSEWFNEFSARDLIGLSTHFTVQQLIQRRNFKERWGSGKEIGLHELDYPLLQGYDSVAVKSDVEIGGSDQLFNLKAGRKIQEIFGMTPQDIITLEMLMGLDGRKMSTTWGNVINITDAPKEQYGKIMSMRDELIINYLKLTTRMPLMRIEKIEKDLKKEKINPRDIKAFLAREIVKIYHGADAAKKTENDFDLIFQKKELPLDVPLIRIEKEKINILELLFKTGFVSSKSEAKRIILQGGVKINGGLQNNWKEIIDIKKGTIIQVGKRKFAKIG